ncbi:MAG TPA: HNH endonuclease signature motif containing protein [Gemmataceae bacterium]|nr:HNH endonuclease signature motif containing protein [Gemmataceae bacterium]
MDVIAFLTEFQDHLAPRLDTYEQAIYLYVFRHSRLIGQEEVVLGFKSARSRMATGIGEKGKPMAEGTCYEKLRPLQYKGCLEIVSVERMGSRIRLRLPNEIPGIIVEPPEEVIVSLEDMDFFTDEANRKLILAREEHKCFYCLRRLKKENHVIDHVVSRPEGNNGYRNVVAACRDCNNRKGASDAEDFFRVLYREGFLSNDEFQQRLSHLQRLRAGELRPSLALNAASPRGDGADLVGGIPAQRVAVAPGSNGCG